MPENRNLLLAIVLSMAVLLGWQLLVGGPAVQEAQQQAEQQALTEQQTADAPVAGADNPVAAPATPAPAPAPDAAALVTLSRDEALAESQRVPIATASLSGSVNLTGGRIDDLRLTQFHETVDSTSPTIVLLSPDGGPDAYFADFGWRGPDSAGPYPGPQTEWSAPAGATLSETQPLTLTYDNGAGLTFERTVSVDDRYLFTISDRVENNGTQPVSVSAMGQVTRVGTPKVAGFYILHEGLIGVTDGLQEVGYGGIRDEGVRSWTDFTGGWLGFTDKYWAVSLMPGQDTRLNGSFNYTELPLPTYRADYAAAPATIAPGESTESTSHLFAGAKQVDVVEGYGEALNIKQFDLLIDWGRIFGIHLYLLTKPMFWLIDHAYSLLGNFGLAILAVTVLVKLLFFPLANKSYASMSAMKKIQPQIMEIREKYKDDRVKQQQLQMELFKREKVNPLAGCWPVLIQIPVFMSIYAVLFISIEMRHAPFFGWIQDLSAPDPTTVFNLFGLIPWDPSTAPMIGGLLTIGAWPLVMGITMFLQMKLNPTPPDATQAMIFNWMPVLFTFMLASFPAGLVIYWAWNNTLSIAQQYFIMRRNGVEIDLLGNIAGTFGRGKPPAKANKSETKKRSVAETDSTDKPTAAEDTESAPLLEAPAEARSVKSKKSRSKARNKPRRAAPAAKG